VHIEKIDEGEDHYEDIGWPKELGVFNTLKEAEELVAQLG
jgi:hypothetical protein